MKIGRYTIRTKIGLKKKAIALDFLNIDGENRLIYCYVAGLIDSSIFGLCIYRHRKYFPIVD